MPHRLVAFASASCHPSLEGAEERPRGSKPANRKDHVVSMCFTLASIARLQAVSLYRFRLSAQTGWSQQRVTNLNVNLSAELYPSQNLKGLQVREGKETAHQDVLEPNPSRT